jgi:hypothetical protein
MQLTNMAQIARQPDILEMQKYMDKHDSKYFLYRYLTRPFVDKNAWWGQTIRHELNIKKN